MTSSGVTSISCGGALSSPCMGVAETIKRLQEHSGNALAQRGDEGRGTLR